MRSVVELWDEYAGKLILYYSFKNNHVKSEMKNSIFLIHSLIRAMVISNDIEPVTHCLTEYGTFFDGTTYYINNNSKYQSLNDRQRLMVFLTDVFYANQNYTMLMRNSTIESLQGQALLFLYFLRFYSDHEGFKVYYKQQYRHKLMRITFQEFDIKDFFVPHEMNKNCFEYILNLKLKHNKLKIKSEEQSFFGKKIILDKVESIFILADKIITEFRYNIELFFNNDNKRLLSNSITRYEIQEQINMVNKITHNI